MYFAAYLLYLFWSLESELVHWVTLVFVPLTVALWLAPRRHRSVAALLATFGLRFGNLSRGVVWAVLLGAVLTTVQLSFGRQAEVIRKLLLSDSTYLLLPVAFVLMLVTAAFTEEFFFRGFLQTRLTKLVRGRWLAALLSALLFAVYHLPYTLLSAHWPSHGHWSAAWQAALGNGLPVGVLLGGLYVVSRGNLLACVVLHALIDTMPALRLLGNWIA